MFGTYFSVLLSSFRICQCVSLLMYPSLSTVLSGSQGIDKVVWKWVILSLEMKFKMFFCLFSRLLVFILVSCLKFWPMGWLFLEHLEELLKSFEIF